MAKSDIEFLKMHGAGNDFIMIDDMDLSFDGSEELIASLCAAHTGIGADGLILIQPSRRVDFRMRYYNRDGREAKMCGNGARCAALFAHTRSVARQLMRFETGAGDVDAEVDGGAVSIGIGKVSDYDPGVRLTDSEMVVAYAVCGVPHAALFTDDIGSWDSRKFEETARSVRYDGAFAPSGTNFNLVSVERNGRIAYRTYERGVEAETLACGTGAVSISVIAAKMGFCSSPVECSTSGGDILTIEFDLTDYGAEGCRLTGPARVSFSGSVHLPDYP